MCVRAYKVCGKTTIYFVAQPPKLGLNHPTVEVSISHTNPAGLLWTSDQLVTEAATYETHNKHKRRTSMPSAGFQPAIPAIERSQMCALDSTANGIGMKSHIIKSKYQFHVRVLCGYCSSYPSRLRIWVSKISSHPSVLLSSYEKFIRGLEL